MNGRIVIPVLCAMFLALALQAQPKDADKEDESREEKVLKLNLQKAIEYLIQRNYDVKKALLDYRGATIPLKQYQAKYDVYLQGGVNYGVQRNDPDAALTGFPGIGSQPDVSNSIRGNVGVSKGFSTGTSITASIMGMYTQGIEGMPVTMGGEGYQTDIKVELAQELLKNAFGKTDRLEEKQLENNTRMHKEMVKLQLSQLMVEAIIGYWNVAVAEENLKTSKLNLNSTVNIRNLITRKRRLGLSEQEDILDWNAKVSRGRSALDQAEKMLFDARQAVSTTLNLEEGIEFDVSTTFVKEEPVVTYDQALRDAFANRIDWKNQKVRLKNAKLSYEVASNHQLPSMKLKVSAGNSKTDPDNYGETFKLYPELNVGLELSYPLGNREGNAKMSEARLNLMKEEVSLKQLENSIRDEVASNVRQCQVAYNVYKRSRESRVYSQRYYQQVLAKFRRGRYSALELKMALDSYIQSRYQELKSLVDYNSALVRRDMSRNILFEKYEIDVDRILSRIEN